MFTGIVEETGTLLELEPRGSGRRLKIAARSACEDLAIGDSIAVDGCCLTAVEAGPDYLFFDVLAETMRLTRLAQVAVGDPLNLERSLRYAGKVGGHFVSGHIDALGTVEEFSARGSDHYLRIAVPSAFSRYLIYKGSVAINGVSLTVAELHPDAFAVWLIPHTLKATNLGGLTPGAVVNLEFDLLGKYVERLFPGFRELKDSTTVQADARAV